MDNLANYSTGACAGRAAGRAVILPGSGGKYDLPYVGWIDSGARHYHYTPGGLPNKACYKTAALQGGRGLAGSKESIATKRNYVFKGPERIGAFVESPMKGNIKRARGGDETRHKRHVNLAVRSEGSDNYSIDLQAFTD